MDKRVRPAYSRTMFGRITALLAILSFAVVTAITAAHVLRMAPGDGMAGDMSDHVMTASGDGAAQPCCPDDSARCAAVCAGVPVLMSPETTAPLVRHVTARPDLPAALLLHGQSPGLNERPPRTRLL